jgi:hypothetical protein
MAQRSGPDRIQGREEQCPIDSRAELNSGENCHSYHQIGSIIRWLDDTTTDATSDKLADSTEIEDAVAYDIDSAGDAIKGVPERDGIDAPWAMGRWVSPDSIFQETESEATCVNDSTGLTMTQAVIEFHHKAVYQLLQEFRQWQAHISHGAGANSNGSAPVSSYSAVANTGNESPSNGIHRTNQSSSVRGRKRRSDDGDDGPPSPKRNKNDTPDEAGSRRTLACPFAKKDPLRYRKCFGYTKIWNTSRLK